MEFRSWGLSMGKEEVIQFTPWKKDYIKANKFFLVSACWLAIGMVWCAQSHSTVAIVVTLFVIVPMYCGFKHFDKGSVRVYGQNVEKHAVNKILEILPDDWRGEKDVQIK